MRAAFKYCVVRGDSSESQINYQAGDLNSYMRSLVLYKPGRIVDYSGTRDVNDWVAREIHFEKFGVSKTFIAKFHRHWVDSNDLAQTQALALSQANTYVAHLLQGFQHSIMKLWMSHPDPGYADFKRLRELHCKVEALKVAKLFILRGVIGLIKDLDSGWYVCSPRTHARSDRYVIEYNFSCDRVPDSDPWTLLVQALVHYSYHVSGGKTLIVQLDCDIQGMISNVVCYNHSEIKSIGGDVGPVIERAFWHFKQDHHCNQICQDIGMLRVQ
ncbi:hypothetical protein DFH28DRAFT_913197 [Melampsora americana]|nr:hypothetical protein DFH28DRAFT_913197 [Melampsora americana]